MSPRALTGRLHSSTAGASSAQAWRAWASARQSAVTRALATVTSAATTAVAATVRACATLNAPDATIMPARSPGALSQSAEPSPVTVPTSRYGTSRNAMTRCIQFRLLFGAPVAWPLSAGKHDRVGMWNPVEPPSPLILNPHKGVAEP
jgi:hypothetical protein